VYHQDAEAPGVVSRFGWFILVLWCLMNASVPAAECNMRDVARQGKGDRGVETGSVRAEKPGGSFQRSCRFQLDLLARGSDFQ
jgi:hypothetical protein